MPGVDRKRNSFEKVAFWKPGFGSEIGRASHALSQAAAEAVMAGAFVLALAFMAMYGSEHLAKGAAFGYPEAQLTLHFWEPEPDRIEKTETVLRKTLPAHSLFRVQEASGESQSRYSQSISVHVEYGSLIGFLRFHDLQDELWNAVVQARGGITVEYIKLRSPEPVVLALWLQVALIPWLLIRFWILPKDCPPARPLIAKGYRTTPAAAGCAMCGLIVGVLAPWIFNAASALGLLTFSDQMPTLDSFGISPDKVLAAALLFALAGAVEEAFFRGIVLRRFVQNHLPHFGVLICALWFTALHFGYLSSNSGNIIYALWIFIGGLGLGFLTLHFRSWIPAAGFHATYNFSVILFAGLPNPPG